MSIRETSVKTAYPLAEVVLDQGLRLNPVKDTPLEELVQSSYYPKDTECNDINELAKNISVVSTFPVGSNKDGEPTYVTLEELVDEQLSTFHSNLMDEEVTRLSSAVRKHIHFARNVVNPLVTDLQDKIGKDLDITIMNQSAGSKMDIISFTLPDVVNDYEFMEEFNKYEGKRYGIEDNQYLKIPVEVDSVYDLISTNRSDIDDSLKEAFYNNFDNSSDSNAKRILSNLFDFNANNAKDEESFTFSDINRKLNVYEKFYAGIILYNACKKLINDPHPSIKGITLDELSNKIRDIQDYAGSLVYTNYNIIKSFIESGILILAINPHSLDEKSAIVVGEVYNQWIKQEGNKPEIIFGLIVTNNIRLRTVNEINENKDSLIKEWNHYCNIFNATQGVSVVNKLKILLLEKLNHQLDEPLDNDLYKIIENIPDYRGNVISKAKDIVNEINYEDFKNNKTDLYEICLKLVAYCRFYFTSAFTILNSMYNTLKSDPNLDVNEAALLATIDYLADYLVLQIVKVP